MALSSARRLRRKNHVTALEHLARGVGTGLNRSTVRGLVESTHINFSWLATSAFQGVPGHLAFDLSGYRAGHCRSPQEVEIDPLIRLRDVLQE